jgi:hypothetical protein
MTALPLAREGGNTDLDEEQARAVRTVDFGREPATLRRGQPRQNAHDPLHRLIAVTNDRGHYP